MPKFRFQGPMAARLRSLWTINAIAVTTFARHLVGRRMTPDWDAQMEIGIRYWRHQHAVFMRAEDKAKARVQFEALLTETDDHYDVSVEQVIAPRGTWYRPAIRRGDSVVLHFHGGGCGLHSGISKRFAAMLAHRLQCPVFAPDYRLTPEHPHPAQAEDAMTAWHYMTGHVPPERLVVTGDSAGGHMALMLLQALAAEGLAQPSLCVGLCPWTDIGDRGESLRMNDRYDLVQGWMAIEFGQWLDPQGLFDREALSPSFYDYAGLAPIYLQAGGREVLRDMIIEFAKIQRRNGALIALDIWPDMPHEFQAYDRMTVASTEALGRMAEAVQSRSLPPPIRNTLGD
ncbi:MAG: alpha/beta hydrolase fold domain-containing protein [Pseudomonadota bacterium]